MYAQHLRAPQGMPDFPFLTFGTASGFKAVVIAQLYEEGSQIAYDTYLVVVQIPNATLMFNLTYTEGRWVCLENEQTANLFFDDAVVQERHSNRDVMQQEMTAIPLPLVDEVTEVIDEYFKSAPGLIQPSEFTTNVWR